LETHETSMTRSRLEALGVYVPQAVVTNQEIESKLGCPGAIEGEKIARVTGVGQRHVCGQSSLLEDSDQSDENGMTLAVQSARRALELSRHKAEDLEVVISCSVTRTRGDRLFTFEPSFAASVKNEIGAPDAIHFDVTNACAGMLTGVAILDGLIRSGEIRCGMVVSGENASLAAETAVREVTRGYNPQFSALTTGDAGVALILEASDGAEGFFDHIELMTRAEGAELCLGMPSDRSQGMSLYTDNRAMHNEERFKIWPNMQNEFLAERGGAFSDEGFDFIIHHQFGATAVELMNTLAAQEFGAEMPTNLMALEEYGNTASTTHFVVLDKYLRNGVLAPGSKVLLVPTAAGQVFGHVSLIVGRMQLDSNARGPAESSLVPVGGMPGRKQ
jgi:3-oxoacyl-[acyl-carrier-protein] synthase III